MGRDSTSPRRFWIGLASMLAVPLVFFLVFVFVRMEGIISPAKTDTITVAIMPVEVSSDDEDLISFASSLQNSLALALSHVKAFSVINVSSRTNGAHVAAELVFYSTRTF